MGEEGHPAADGKSQSQVFDRILDLAKPHLGVRDNLRHTEIAGSFAMELLREVGGDPAVILPAIALHDVGYSAIPEELINQAFGPEAKDSDLRRKHEVEGAKIAARILTEENFPADGIEEITTIIDGHDTRMESLSLNDEVVKDADKLFRMTPVGINMISSTFGVDKAEHVEWLEKRIEGWFFTAAAKRMARELLAERRLELAD